MGTGEAGIDHQRFAPARPEVIDEVVAGEAVIVHLGTGRYFALNPAATALWTWIGTGCSIAELDGQDVGTTALFRAWIDEGLIVASPGSPGPDGQVPMASGAGGGVAEMRVFTDLQDLLLLDPIHDVAVGDDGFPVTRASS